MTSPKLVVMLVEVVVDDTMCSNSLADNMQQALEYSPMKQQLVPDDICVHTIDVKLVGDMKP